MGIRLPRGLWIAEGCADAALPSEVVDLLRPDIANERSYRAGAADYSARRIRFYLACAYLKLAYVIGVAQRPRNWDRLALALLREAQRFVLGGQI